MTKSKIEAARASLGAHITSHLIAYSPVRAAKQQLLEISFARFSSSTDPVERAEFATFRAHNSAWLPDYCLFKILMEINGEGLTWDQWPAETSTPENARRHVAGLRKTNPGHIDSRTDYFAYVQWLCFRQWRDLRAHADAKGVKLMGDLPIGVSFHSADVFFNRSEFLTDWFGGTAPEGYSATDPFIHEWGQNWGIPIYNWGAMEKNGFTWWKQRVAHLTGIFRMFRIDHILGFYRIYGFPWHPRRNHEFLGLDEREAAEITGGPLPRWFQRPDDIEENKEKNLADGDFRLRAIAIAAGDAEIIAEDLGWVPEYVRPHLEELGICRVSNPPLGLLPRRITGDGTCVSGNVSGFLFHTRSRFFAGDLGKLPPDDLSSGRAHYRTRSVGGGRRYQRASPPRRLFRNPHSAG